MRGFPLQPLGLSLTIHAVLLFVGGLGLTLPPAEPASPPLHALLRPATTPVTTTSGIDKAPPVLEKPGVAALRHPAVLPAPRPQPETRESVMPQTEPAAPSRRDAITPAPSLAAVRPVASAAGVRASAEEAAASRAGMSPHRSAMAEVTAESGPDAAALRQFRLVLAGEARRFRRYPAMARQAGLSGTVEVRVAVEADSAVRHADLNRSSGHAVLDNAALDMLRAAVARAELPAALRGRSFAVLLPVVFTVEE